MSGRPAQPIGPSGRKRCREWRRSLAWCLCSDPARSTQGRVLLESQPPETHREAERSWMEIRCVGQAGVHRSAIGQPVDSAAAGASKAGIVIQSLWESHRSAPGMRSDMRLRRTVVFPAFVISILCCFPGTSMAGEKSGDTEKYYRITNGSVDSRTYNGYRRYHSACNHCHGADGLGSTFGPELIDHLPDI